MRPRTTPLQAFTHIAEIARQLDALPTARQLAAQHHISESQVRYIMRLARAGKVEELLAKWKAPTEVLRHAIIARDSSFVQRSDPPRVLDPPPSSPQLDQLCAEVMLAHEMREDRCETLPLQRRPFTPRPRPQTAIIGNRANELIAAREWAEQADENAVEPNPADSQST
jgi:hypothetical protein